MIVSCVLRAVVAKNRRGSKNDPLQFSSFIAILKALFNLSILENFQSNQMIGTNFYRIRIFTGSWNFFSIFAK
jgi:hypothetical protein